MCLLSNRWLLRNMHFWLAQVMHHLLNLPLKVWAMICTLWKACSWGMGSFHRISRFVTITASANFIFIDRLLYICCIQYSPLYLFTKHPRKGWWGLTPQWNWQAACHLTIFRLMLELLWYLNFRNSLFLNKTSLDYLA